ncbi:pyrroloquinoline quinone biosynthesis protein PqqE [Acidocella aromatica]|uniref:PqqA peptide cyclase n=1 Tax=Acidocella aromatica TaxID=1303579 RepID=A0A840V890_9PROT|nr:pyrroloquinoline quinone biosynthesis protein PqqE [Acidocella aromatica]MBB5372178.1 pyrroloquinoline quinone biosynthesis protein E [Acidocella aromatica]
MTTHPPPMALLAELTHRCPLQCPYCSNPLELLKANAERDTDFWKAVMDEAAALGVLQIHFSGGEPTLRRDLPELVAHASKVGLYTNLITSAVLLDEAKLRILAEAGLDHVQVSIQGADAQSADRIAAYEGAHAKKLEVARLVPQLGMALTLNAVVHRQNLNRLDEIINLAVELGAGRLEVAHVQYHGWALANRAALIPDEAALARADAIVAERREALRGQLVIDYVLPDLHADLPKTCMDGWGSRFINIAPDGRVLPCHAADSIPGMSFERAGERELGAIWDASDAFQRFRGTEWMQEPCRSCDRRDVDFGGCRCQALALVGDATATDPVCHRSPHHARIREAALAEAAAPPPDFRYRRP